MSPKFVIAFSYRLAMELCTALNLEGRLPQITQMFIGTSQEAMESDANQYRDMINHVDLADTMNGTSSIDGYFGT